MRRIKLKWNTLEYKTKFYVFMTLGVLLLFSAVFLFSNLNFYQSGVSIASLTQRTNETTHIVGIVSVTDTYPPFSWMGKEPDTSVSEIELPYQESGTYVITGSLEDICRRLIQAGFLFSTEYGGTTLVSKSKICYLYKKNHTLIAQIEKYGGT